MGQRQKQIPPYRKHTQQVHKKKRDITCHQDYKLRQLDITHLLQWVKSKKKKSILLLTKMQK